MRWEFIESLRCPYSGSRFNRSSIAHEDDSGIHYGIITIEAGEFPIIDAILRLKVDEFHSHLVNLIKSKQYQQALLASFEVPSFNRRAAAVNFFDRVATSLALTSIARCLRLLKKPLYRAFT